MAEVGEVSYATLDRIGRIRLSEHFFLREFLYSETAIRHGLVNIPDDLDLAVEAGKRLCVELLEPLQARFGRVHVRSAFRSCAVNQLGNEQGLNCARNEVNYADHIWDRRDAAGQMGATACIVLPEVADYLSEPGKWVQLAWWIHDHLPYASLYFFSSMIGFNIQSHDQPKRRIDSYVGWFDFDGKWQKGGTLTKPGMPNHEMGQAAQYAELARKFAL